MQKKTQKRAPAKSDIKRHKTTEHWFSHLCTIQPGNVAGILMYQTIRCNTTAFDILGRWQEHHSNDHSTKYHLSL